jgi:hypothetical protein
MIRSCFKGVTFGYRDPLGMTQPRPLLVSQIRVQLWTIARFFGWTVCF